MRREAHRSPSAAARVSAGRSAGNRLSEAAIIPEPNHDRTDRHHRIDYDSGAVVFITRLASIALTMTGLSENTARFQARSAFTGTGYTTSEAETVVNHPVRRRIVMGLMALRSAGLVTIVLSLILSFAGEGDRRTVFLRLALLSGGLIVMTLASKSRFVDRWLAVCIRRALSRWTDIDLRDYAGLLKLSDGYAVMEIQLQKEDWLAGKTLNRCNLRKEGVNVLGITREDGGYVGAPKGSTRIDEGDTLLLYGRSEDLKELSRRRKGIAGDAEHNEAVDEQKQVMNRQDRQERRHNAWRRVQKNPENQARNTSKKGVS